MTEVAVLGSEDVAAIGSEESALAALAAVDEVNSPEDAEALLRKITAYQQAVRLAKIGHVQERRWAGIRLQAERKMGELLGAAEVGGHRDAHVTGGHVEPEERKTHERARKVAAIPADTFAAYLTTADEPTRAGLLRAARPAGRRKP